MAHTDQPASNLAGHFWYLHGDHNVTTLAQLIAYKDYDSLTPKQILDIKGNAERIFAAYRPSDKEKYDKASADLLEVGTRLYLPTRSITVDRISNEGNRFIVPNDDATAFISRALNNLVSEVGYEQAQHNRLSGSVTKNMPNVTVWIWCKSLGEVGGVVGSKGKVLDGAGSNDIQGQIFNLTPFIESVSINVGATGGGFTITLPPLTCESNNAGWQLKKTAIQHFTDNQGNLNYLGRDSIFRQVEGEYRANNFLFHNIVNANDIVWIRFEPLRNEKDRTQTGPVNPIISKDELPGKNYDMIGLIDRNSIRSDYGSTNVGITLSGRDLMKVLIEDSTTWINIPNLKPSEGVFFNANWKSFGRPVRRFDRLGPQNNPLAYSLLYRAPTIAEAVSVLFGSLATLEIAPDSLFSAYPKEYNPATQQEGISSYLQFNPETNTADRLPGAGIWQIIKVLVDKTVKDFVIADDSISTYEGSLLNGLQKYVQRPFAELYGDTYKDQYYFIIRRPPTDKAGYLSLVELCKQTPAQHIHIDHVISDSLAFDDSEVFCWYKLQPRGLLGGTGVDLDPFSLKIVYFREYNEIWGNRSLDITSNYLPRPALVGKDTVNDHSVQDMRKKMEYDLRFLVESNAYTPFTRKGTITLHGDRRIKRGTIVFYELTGEYYYVEAVSNTYQIANGKIERTTTLTVSRGMVDKLPNGNQILEKYFEIIEFSKPDYNNQDKRPVFDWYVNTNIFQFFLKRLQFTDSIQVSAPV